MFCNKCGRRYCPAVFADVPCPNPPIRDGHTGDGD